MWDCRPTPTPVPWLCLGPHRLGDLQQQMCVCVFLMMFMLLYCLLLVVCAVLNNDLRRSSLSICLGKLLFIKFCWAALSVMFRHFPASAALLLADRRLSCFTATCSLLSRRASVDAFSYLLLISRVAFNDGRAARLSVHAFREDVRGAYYLLLIESTLSGVVQRSL